MTITTFYYFTFFQLFFINAFQLFHNIFEIFKQLFLQLFLTNILTYQNNNHKIFFVNLISRKVSCVIRNKMIKRLIEYLVTERRTEYIQYKSSSKSNSARNYTSYSILKVTSIISTLSFIFMFQ